MNKEIIGYLSAGLVFASALVYMLRVWQKVITANPVTWFVFAIEGITILIIYKSGGAKENAFPAYFGAINPVVIVLLALFFGKTAPLEWSDWACLACALIALIIWGLYTFLWHEQTNVAIATAIVGDAIACVPTLLFLRRSPDQDRPFAWCVFAIGYGLALLIVPKYDFFNVALPIYMTGMSLAIATPLIYYRIKNKIPIKEWI